MKKLKTVAIISGVLTFLQLIPVVFQAIMRLYFKYDLKMASAIGVIGSADGPTSIVVLKGVSLLLVWARHGFLLLCAVTFIVSTVIYFKRRNT